VRIGVPAEEPGLIVKKLGEHHRFVVASHDYLNARGEPESPEDLADHECMRFSYRAGLQRWVFRRAGKATEVEVTGRLSMNNSELLREAALGGHGIALLPQWLVHEDVRAGRLRRLFEEWEINPQRESVCVYAAYLPNRRHSRKVRAFLDFLQSCVSGPLEAFVRQG
jgi:DNA-binding transcriptional LysR family regulator